MLRHGGDAVEMAFANLLSPAGIVEMDNLDRQGVGEVRHRRVVEANVSVLADSDKAGVDGRLGEQGAIAAALSFHIRRVTVNIVHGAQRNAVGQPRLQPPPETRRMRHRHAGVLVQVERLDGAPAEVWGQYEW